MILCCYLSKTINKNQGIKWNENVKFTNVC